MLKGNKEDAYAAHSLDPPVYYCAPWLNALLELKIKIVEESLMDATSLLHDANMYIDLSQKLV